MYNNWHLAMKFIFHFLSFFWWGGGGAILTFDINEENNPRKRSVLLTDAFPNPMVSIAP